MNFVRKNKYYSKSKEGYTVSVAIHDKAYTFSAWAGQNELLGVFDKSSDAYQCCEDHYDGNKQ